MRIVAGVTGLHWVMGHRVNLGKAGGPRRIISVTERTVAALPGRLRMDIGRRFDVRRRRPVTHFTRHVGVTVAVVRLDNILMTHGAGFVPGVFDFARDVVVNRSCPVMAQFAKSLRNKIMTCRDQGDDE